MFDNAYDELKARGFIEQVTNEETVRELLGAEKVAFYIGYDPSADSFHTGSMVPLMVMHFMQKYGHKPIAILGSGTMMVGDPSGKTEMRRLLKREEIVANGKKISRQIGRFIDLNAEGCHIIDNADWLLKLNYIEFLRDIGRHFSVNRMLAAEAYKMRLETGLSFIEFNYQLLQAYDYLVLFEKYDCKLQMGGNDQWGNILAGTELIRRIHGADTHAMTFPLLTTATGEKMGKTAAGAIWLSAEKTSPYDFYQYWINCDDRDVIRFLKFFTPLSLEKISEFENLEGADLRQAKRRLAFEVTAFLHGKQKAEKAESAAKAIFSGGTAEGAPETTFARDDFKDGMPVVQLFTQVGLTSSNGEARRMARSGGLYVNDQRVENEMMAISPDDFEKGRLILRMGKKKYHVVRIA
jgi:tyrosyl-tRNA synthetase